MLGLEAAAVVAVGYLALVDFDLAWIAVAAVDVK
jgi:hypothetical protein